MMSVPVAVVMGSSSDRPRLEAAFRTLEELEIPFVVRVLSAHRTPEEAAAFARGAEDAGFRVIIAAAGGAAHLAGAMAASTLLPVIGVPLAVGALNGWDALLSTVQMPGGVPVATVAVGDPGAKNAAMLAARILALNDSSIRTRLERYGEAMADRVRNADRQMSQPEE